jgi:hypothetical protein
MNGAALNAFMSLFDNSDKKRKEDEQKRFERDRAAAKEDEQSRFERGIQKDINDENRASNVAMQREQEARETNAKIAANRPTLADGTLIGPQRDRYIISDVTREYEPKVAAEHGLKNDEWRKALMTINNSPIIQTLRDAGIPTDQLLEMTGGSVDPAAIRAALGNLDAITKGVVPAQNSAVVAASKDAEGRSAIGSIENNKRLSNPSMIKDLVASGDNAKLSQNKLGGMDPYRIASVPQYLTINPDGTSTMVKNPAFTGESGGFDGGGMLTADPLEMGAAQLGFEKASVEYDANFRPIKRVNSIPVPTTGEVERPPTFVIDGKPVAFESKQEDFMSQLQDPNRRPVSRIANPPGFTGRSTGASGAVNLFNPWSPHNVVNKIYGSEGMGVAGEAHLGAKLTEDDLETLKQLNRPSIITQEMLDTYQRNKLKPVLGY